MTRSTNRPPPRSEAEAKTSIIHEPSLENPGADAAVGNAAETFGRRYRSCRRTGGRPCQPA